MPGASRLGRSTIFCLSEAGHHGLIPFVLVDLGSGMGYNPHHYGTAGMGHSWEDLFCSQKINISRDPLLSCPWTFPSARVALIGKMPGNGSVARGCLGKKLGRTWILDATRKSPTSELLHVPNGKCHCYLRHVLVSSSIIF